MEKTYTINELSEKLYPVFSSAPVYKAILFGSYAKGNATNKSDVDIYVDSHGELRGFNFYGVLEDNRPPRKQKDLKTGIICNKIEVG